MFNWKENILFKQKYLIQAQDFYDQYGGGAIVFARFVPIVRTFAPIIAGIVNMDKKRFTLFNVAGSFAWVGSMLTVGHFLQGFLLRNYGIDISKHLELIVLAIVFVTTAPVIFKLVFGKPKPSSSK